MAEVGASESAVHRRLYDLAATGEASFSFEFFVPDTLDGLDDLRPRVDRLASTEPAFVDVVAVGGLAATRRALRLAHHAHKIDGVPAMLHITCADMTVEDTRTLLVEARDAGVLNIVVERGVSEVATAPAAPSRAPAPGGGAGSPIAALPGAPSPLVLPGAAAGARGPGVGGPLEAALRAGTLAPMPRSPAPGVVTASTPALSALSPHRAARPAFVPTPGGFEHAADAVAWVRAEFGAAFSVGVMGYPCGHGEYGSLEEDMEALRAKVAAGADFVLAQHVHEARTFLDWREAVGRAGVAVPIIASVMPVQSYDSFMQVNAYTGVAIPPSMLSTLQSLAEDRKAVREFGNRHVVALMKDLMAAGVNVLHLHTLNLEAVIRSVLQDVGLCGPGAGARRKLPWRPSGDAARRAEDVRPIYWANRPASYLQRTAGWEHYPSGRWGSAPAERAFCEVAPELVEAAVVDSVEERRAMWFENPVHHGDVWEVFARYVEGRVPRLPWCEVTLHPETSTISTALSRLNRAGFLTINSQPRVNGARSEDATFGWGGTGGYVYQKAYVECFAPPRNLAALMHAVAAFPTITFQAADAAGNTYSNYRTRGAQAVTWGVFPAKEIIQPTVVDPDAFLEWKKEAFALWLSSWATAYEPDSPASELIHDIHDTYFLVNLVDNDFLGGDIFAVFEAAVALLAASKDGIPPPAYPLPSAGSTPVRAARGPHAPDAGGFGGGTATWVVAPGAAAQAPPSMHLLHTPTMRHTSPWHGWS